MKQKWKRKSNAGMAFRAFLARTARKMAIYCIAFDCRMIMQDLAPVGLGLLCNLSHFAINVGNISPIFGRRIASERAISARVIAG